MANRREYANNIPPDGNSPLGSGGMSDGAYVANATRCHFVFWNVVSAPSAYKTNADAPWGQSNGRRTIFSRGVNSCTPIWRKGWAGVGSRHPNGRCN